VKYLVTGGAGFIGSHLVDALVAGGQEVRVLDNVRRGRWQHLERHIQDGSVTPIEGDIRDEDGVQSAMRDIDVVYHLAAQSNVLGAVADPRYSFETNVLGTFNVLRAASREGVRRVVFSSSREVYGEPECLPVREDAPLVAKNPYGASKVAGEAYCRAWEAESGGRCVILRFSNVYGLRDTDRIIPRWLELARRGEDLPIYGGDQLLDFVSVDKAVAALLAAEAVDCTAPVNVASGQGTRITDLAARILDLAPTNSRLRFEPARGYEVVRFLADVTRMRTVLCLAPSEDPLDRLQDFYPSLHNVTKS
jgi:UDP-glucose 4-epimerase